MIHIDSPAAPQGLLIAVFPDDESAVVVVGHQVNEADAPAGSWALALVDSPVEVFNAAPDLTQVTVVGWRCGWPTEAIVCRLVATSADEAICGACKIFNVSNDYVPAAVLRGWPAVRRLT